MKRRASNPFRVILSGIIDLALLAAGLFINFLIFRKTHWNVHIGNVFYPVPGFIATGFLLGYIFLVLPFFDAKGGSWGKRIMRLQCTGMHKSQPVSFGNFLFKSLLYGFPIMVGFAMSFRLFPLNEGDTSLAIDIIDIVLLSVFFIQLLTLFIGRRSLFEIVSRSIIASKKNVPEPDMFSFENENIIAEALLKQES